MNRRWPWIAAYAFVAILGVVRIASTFRLFSETLDEPAHIASGYDWLIGRPYTLDPTHPPLERVLSAVPAVLQHVPPSDDPNFIARGNGILYFADRYEGNLARARSANLLFFLLGLLSVAAWGRRLYGEPAGLIGSAFFASLPPILGHTGVATTDMSVAALVPLALLLLDRWLDEPSFRRGAIAGVGIGLGMLAKFSFPVFFGVGALVLVAFRLLRKNARFAWRPALLGVAVSGLLLWAGYRFDFGTVAAAHRDGEYAVTEAAPAFARGAANWFARKVPLPAPLFFFGGAAVKLHDRDGHYTYFLGETGRHGWWSYFPVVFFYKTPLPFLMLVVIGGALLLLRGRRSRDVPIEVLAIPAAMMLVVLPSSINIGIRHILPIYALLCVVAAYAVIEVWRRREWRVATVALLVWMFAGVAAVHPDYLAWFNEAAGRHPEKIVVDSNLDWGQDVLRLGRTVRRLHIDRLSILYTGNALLERHGIVADAIQPWTPAPGWYVLSETGLKLNPDARRGAYKWLEDYRMRQVGKSMRLYHVPEH